MTFAERRSPSAVPSYRVVVPGVPAERFLELHAYVDSLVEELAVRTDDVSTQQTLRHLVPLAKALTDGGPFAESREASRAEAERALENGDERFTLIIDVPVVAANAVALWNGLLDAADWAGSRGLLTTHPASPDVVDLRRWIGNEVSRALPDSPTTN